MRFVCCSVPRFGFPAHAAVAVLAALAVMAGPAAPAAAQLPETDIYVAPLTLDGRVTVGPPGLITGWPGYENQPCFTDDSNGLLFTAHDPASDQTDIYRYLVRDRQTTALTATAESEYSPTPLPDGSGFAVVMVEADSTQRLWGYRFENTEEDSIPRYPILPSTPDVGYFAWAGTRHLALFIVGSPHRLVMSGLEGGAPTPVAEDIDRGLASIPGTNAVSFVDVGTDGRWIRRVAPGEAPTPICRPRGESRDLAWTPDGHLLMAEGNTIFGWDTKREAWVPVRKFAIEGITGITRLAVSPDGSWIAFVADGK